MEQIKECSQQKSKVWMSLNLSEEIQIMCIPSICQGTLQRAQWTASKTLPG
jgi:hypothetical protein